MERNLKTIFFGTPEFGAIVLETLVASGYSLVVVVTAPDKPAGRKQIMTQPPVKVVARKHKIPVLQPENMKAPKPPSYNREGGLDAYIRNLRPDLIVVAAYGKIIPKEILDIPKFGCLNVHPSLLPKYRGPSPIQYAILNGDKETGITIIKMTERVDAGDIIESTKYEVRSTKIFYKDLEKELAELGAKLLIETIPKWIAGEIKPRPQNEAKASYTKILKKEDGKIDWSRPAEYIERQIRALNPWPGTFTKYEVRSMKSEEKKEKVLKIYEAEALPCKINKQPGKVFLTEDKKMAVQTGQDCLIIEKLQLEGKKIMTAKEFLNGHPEIIGSILD